MTYDLNEHNRVLALTTAQEKAIKDYIELRSHFYSNSMKYSQEINYKDYEKPLYHESLFPDSDEYFIYFHPLSKEPSSPIKLHIPLSQSKEQMLLVANMINQLQLGDIINQAKIVNPELPSISSNFSNFARVQNS